MTNPGENENENVAKEAETGSWWCQADGFGARATRAQKRMRTERLDDRAAAVLAKAATQDEAENLGYATSRNPLAAGPSESARTRSRTRCR